jgi:Type IV secretion-system coupling protein DNA-binding domain/TraM recognition site of TraD and TraG
MNGYEQLTENVFRWEKRGRGGLLFPEPVGLEPPFVPFPGHRVTFDGPEDDGTRHTFLSRITDRVFKTLQGAPAARTITEPAEPDPDWLGEEVAPQELRLLLPKDMTVSVEGMKLFLSAVSLAHSPLVVEMIGDASGVSFQMSAHEEDLPPLASQVDIHFPGIGQQVMDDELLRVWGNPEDGEERVVVEFGLDNAFMLSLGEPGKSDPFIGLAGALSALDEDEMSAYQVIFSPLTAPWADQVMASLTKQDGKPFFSDGADWVKAAREKVSQPLYGVVVRLAARAMDLDRSWQIIRQMAAPLRLFASQWGNSLIPLSNDGYDEVEHAWDMLFRRSCRCGMILSLHELTGLIRFPTAALKSPRFLRLDEGTHGAMRSEESPGGVLLGLNQHVGTEEEVWLTKEQRVRHIHMIGASGSGKTTLMFNLIQQDIAGGAGFALLDPHGDLVDRVMEIIPAHRRDDVILVDPSDEDFIVPFNFLSAHHDFEKTLLASDLVAVFRAQSTSWGDQMNLVFGNAIRAFLESSVGGTLSDVRRFLLDPKYREQFLKTVTDPDVVLYWKLGFPQLGGNKSIGPILTRLETFLSPKPIRYMVSQQEHRLDFADMMDRGKIFLARLPQGQMGKENSHLLGSLLVAKLQQMAMSRQRLNAKQRRPFYVYVDEFQNFICPSMAEILSGARKYGMGFVLAHQDLRQLDRNKEVASAVLSNAYTRVVFRVSDSDARTLAEGFAHFPAHELQNLPVGHAICRVGQSDNDFNLEVSLAPEPNPTNAGQSRRAVIESSRHRVATPRAEVEALLLGSGIGENKPAATAPESPTKESSQGEAPAPITVAAPNSPPATVSEPDVLIEKSVSGKGGHQHLLMQERIKRAAEAKGFRAVVEHPTGTGNESVDVALLRNDLRIACEVSVSTTIDHEIGNARKCLRDHFDIIALVTGDERRRQQLEKATTDHFPPEDRAKIRCNSPDEFIAYLADLPDPKTEASPEASKSVRGCKVKRRFTTLTPEERTTKTKAAFDLLGCEMKLPAA